MPVKIDPFMDTMAFIDYITRTRYCHWAMTVATIIQTQAQLIKKYNNNVDNRGNTDDNTFERGECVQ